MDLEDSEFLKFVSQSAKYQLNFLIIGGLALNLHGIARTTQDADIWLEPTEENKQKLLLVLVGLGYSQEEIQDIASLDFTQPQVVTIEGPIDLLTQVHRNLNFYKCEAKSKHITIQENPCKVLHIADLRETKILARRPQDYRDVVLIDDFLKKK